MGVHLRKIDKVKALIWILYVRIEVIGARIRLHRVDTRGIFSEPTALVIWIAYGTCSGTTNQIIKLIRQNSINTKVLSYI